MAPSPRLRKLAAFFLTWSLVVTGFAALTTQRGRASEKPLPPPTANASAPEKGTAPKGAEVDEATRARVTEAYSKLPMSFEENRGQEDAEVRYLARGSAYTLFLTPTEVVFSLLKAEAGGRGRASDRRGWREGLRPERRPRATDRQPMATVLRMKLKGASPAPAVTGEGEMKARTSYFKGNDPQKWQKNVARFEQVRYAQVYPGVDMVYYGEQGQLEYDFEVAPGADTQQIALEFSGARSVRIERATGELVLKTADGGEVRQRRPVAYQEVGGERREVASRYVLRGGREVRIEVGEYDRTKPLVIDPVLTYSTYMGGLDHDLATDIAIDSSGIAYLTGYTYSCGFPVKDAFQWCIPSYDSDIFIVKLDTNLSGKNALLYSSYLGGYGWDFASGIALGSPGIVYVTGQTDSIGFPTKNEFQLSPSYYYDNVADAFVTKLDTNPWCFDPLLYSTYLGGRSFDQGIKIAADSTGIAYVTGNTYSADFPLKNPLQRFQTNPLGSDYAPYFLHVFVARINTNRSGAASLTYSTLLHGAANSEELASDIVAAGPPGIVYVAGTGCSPDFPQLNPSQPYGGSLDSFITKLDTTRSGTASLLYSTCLGGEGYDRVDHIAADSDGNVYASGSTRGPGFPTKHQYQKYPGDGDENYNGFVVKLDTNISGPGALRYSTYLGGSGQDRAGGIAVDSSGNIYVTGWTRSPDFPTKNQYQTDQGGTDAFVAKLNPHLSGAASLVYSTYLGGSRTDSGVDIALDSTGSVYVLGNTTSPDLPIKNQYQRYKGRDDIFLMKFIDSVGISGRVTRDGTAGLRGVTVTLDGPQKDSRSRTAVTDGDGNYSFANLVAGFSYTVTASKDGLTFDPQQRTFNSLGENQSDVNFVTSAATVNGRVTIGTAAGAGLGGVTVTLTGGEGFAPRTAQTTSAGDYSFDDVPTPGNYRVTPSLPDYYFGPEQAVLLDVTANQPGTNFVASLKTYTVSGAVRLGPAGLGGVMLRLESPTPDGFATRTAMTDGEGRYSFPNVPAGRSYTVTPVKLGYQFAPATQPVADLSADEPAVNFPVKVYSVGGRVTRAGTTHGLGAVTVTLTSPVPAGFPARTAQTNSLGYYLFTDLPAGRNYTLKPARTGFTFSPAEHDVAKLGGHVPAGTATSFTGAVP